MKYIIAIIQPDRMDDVLRRLTEKEIHLVTVTSVMGRGRQKGIAEVYRSHMEAGTLLKKIKLEIGSASGLQQELTMEVRGRDMISGLPRRTIVSSEEVREALKEPVGAIIDTWNSLRSSSGMKSFPNSFAIGTVEPTMARQRSIVASR